MRAFLLMLVLFAVTLAGCATPALMAPKHQNYPNMVSYYDLAISWDITRDGGITINGAVNNRSYYYLRDLELTATLLGPGGTSLGEKTFFFFPNQLSLDETAPFTLAIPLKEGAAPEKIRFLYRYRHAEEQEKRATPYFQSFEVPLEGRTYERR